ncbi:hypothetical protein MtrunA17_Chr4g0070321 [Medicago truncatula]|uniref:Transmembrane protein n=1 Tax=Medicago truncatula TaxID=3880 RepID=A0A396IJQ1_MEDTR|nr:hypothetical protein MtrunA17_Chr4g0070321 [Medicago truncatula]
MCHQVNSKKLDLGILGGLSVISGSMRCLDLGLVFKWLGSSFLTASF